MPRSDKRGGRAPKLGRIYHTPTWLCPACGYTLDAATGITNQKGKPQDGDFTICLNCGTIARFDKNLRPVLSSMEAARDVLEPGKLATVQKAQFAIWVRGPLIKKEEPS